MASLKSPFFGHLASGTETKLLFQALGLNLHSCSSCAQMGGEILPLGGCCVSVCVFVLASRLGVQWCWNMARSNLYTTAAPVHPQHQVQRSKLPMIKDRY